MKEMETILAQKSADASFLYEDIEDNVIKRRLEKISVREAMN